VQSGDASLIYDVSPLTANYPVKFESGVIDKTLQNVAYFCRVSRDKLAL
jgi:hypothetical protein